MIGANDTLTFSYRITNYSGGGPMILGSNKIEVQVSTDCGTTYQTINSINSLNHSPTINLRTRRIALATRDEGHHCSIRHTSGAAALRQRHLVLLRSGKLHANFIRHLTGRLWRTKSFRRLRLWRRRRRLHRLLPRCRLRD
jgi:hypothetical protein